MKLTDLIKNKIQSERKKNNDRKRKTEIEMNAGANKFTERTQIIMTIIYFFVAKGNNYALHRQMIIVDVCPDNKYGTVRKRKRESERKRKTGGRIGHAESSRDHRVSIPSHHSNDRIYLYNRAHNIHQLENKGSLRHNKGEDERCARTILRASECRN